MKKLAFILFLFLLSANAYAEFTVPQDFYLDNSSVITGAQDLRILPNTLRLVIGEGESGELFAESFPEDGYCEAKWHITGEGAKLFPRENTCTVLGIFPCRETVTLSSEDGKAFEIAVEVKPKKHKAVRSFDYEGEPKGESPSPRIMEFSAAVLALCGISLLIFAASSFGRLKKDEK